MRTQMDGNVGARLFSLDNLRIYLTVLVIVHYVTLAYGGAGSWAVRDPGVDDISPIFLSYFNAVNQTYFMSAFFLLAGYFTPSALQRKGGGKFFVDRLIRLGIPILIYTTLIINLNQMLLFALHVLFMPVGIPTMFKFFIVSLIAVPLCFGLALLIRRIPYAKQVLG